MTSPLTGTVLYGYDDVGNRTRLEYPGGEVVSSTYDALNRLETVEDWEGGETRYAYDPAGRVLTETRASRLLTTTYGYDEAGRLERITHTGAHWVLASYTYTLDAVGHRTAVAEYILPPAPPVYLPLVLLDSDGGDSADGEGGALPPQPFDSPLAPPGDEVETSESDTEQVGMELDASSSLTCTYPQAITGTQVISYTYDGLHRLVEAAYSSGECFEYLYDPVGNRKALTETTAFTQTVVTTYTYDFANRLTGVGGVEYTWDARGNLVYGGVFTYTTDGAGRMVGAESLTRTLVYTYNGDGLRVASLLTGRKPFSPGM